MFIALFGLLGVGNVASVFGRPYFAGQIGLLSSLSISIKSTRVKKVVQDEELLSFFQVISIYFLFKDHQNSLL